MDREDFPGRPDRVAGAPQEVPAGGELSCRVTAQAARLLGLCAERSREHWPQAGAAVAQARALEQRAMALAAGNVSRYAAARAALADLGRSSRETAGDWELGRMVEAAADPPLQLSDCAADVAQLAVLVAGHALADFKADAIVAAELAAGAARAATRLVEVNLVVGADPERVQLARRRAAAAGAAARAAVG